MIADVYAAVAAYAPADARRRRPLARFRDGSAPAAAPAGEVPPDPLYALNPRDLWKWTRTQPVSFWLVCLYVFWEYVRPQSIYSALAGPPWAQMTMIGCVVALAFEGRRLRGWSPADGLLALFAGVVLLSSFNAVWPEVAFGKMTLFASWVVVYLLISCIVNTERRFLVFLVLFLLYSFKMSQHGTRSWAEGGFAFRDWGTTGAPGWFQNSGEFGIQMCVFLPLLVFFITALGRYWGRWTRWFWWVAAATAVIGIIGSSSRGALLGGGVVVLWMLMKTRYKGRALLITAVLLVFVQFMLPQEQRDRLSTMGEDGTSVSRETYWANGRQMMEQFPVLGIGYGNWPDYHEGRYGVRALPHNIFIEAGAELGYTGLLAFVALIVCTFAVNRRTRKLAEGLPGGGRFIGDMAHGLDGALVGFLASGFFVTVLYYPFFWINLAMTVALNATAVNELRTARAALPADTADAQDADGAEILVPPRRTGRGGAAWA